MVVEYDPALQSSHAVLAVADENQPAEHATQVVDNEAPIAVLHVPAAHLVQVVFPVVVE